MHRLDLPKDEITAENIILTPDSESLIVLCANGDIIKYSTTTLEQIAANNGVYNSSVRKLSFADNETLLIEGSDTILVDIESLEVKGTVNRYKYYMKDERKFIFYDYGNWGYYDYLTDADVVKYAEEFMEEKLWK